VLKRLPMRALVASKAKIHENNFIVKKLDSESLRRAFFVRTARGAHLARHLIAFHVMQEARVYQRLF